MMDELILQFFEQIRNPALTLFFGIFSLLGEAVIVAAAVILFYWLAPKRTGEQALLCVLSSFCLNSALKTAVGRPRPFVKGTVGKLDPPLGAELDPFASFPSGHAQMTSGFLFTLLLRLKRVSGKILCAAIILLIALSRLYFGVHYPSDVLTGLLCGIALAVVLQLVYEHAERYKNLIALFLAFAATAAVPFVRSADFLQSAGLLAGGTIALALLPVCTLGKPAEFPRRLWRIPTGVALLCFAYSITLLLPGGDGFALLKWFFLAFIGIFGGEIVFERLQI